MRQPSIFRVSINTQVIIQNRALSLSLSYRSHCHYQPIITSTDKMAASSRFATVSEDDFRVEMFCFFLFFEIITCVFILKQLLYGSVAQGLGTTKFTNLIG